MSDSWVACTIRDLLIKGEAEIKTGPFGTQLHASDYVETGTPVINARNIGFGSMRIDKLEFIAEETVQRLSSHLLEPGDIVFGRKGTVERHVFVRAEQAHWFQGTDCLRLRLKSPSVEPRFISYCLLTEYHKKWIVNQSSHGATMTSLNQGIISRIPLRLPPLPAQRKIAAILSAYDDLIENNLRRIKILEEMAQNLYREWFVKFRFPGHELSRFVDSSLGRVPERWEVSVLGKHLLSLESGKRPKGGVGDLESGVPSVGAENIFGIGRHKYQSEKFISREYFEEMRSGIVKDGDVALYKDGAYIGRSTYFRDCFPHPEFCVNEHVFLLRSTGEKLTQNILYLWLQEPATVSAIRATNANAAQPGINQPSVNGLPISVPQTDIAGRFDELVEPIFELIINLAKRNESLRRTRDLLLPKLISGEVDVSELDVVIPEEFKQ